MVILAGCAGTRSVSTERPRSLAEVNRVLADREAQIELDDGAVVTGLNVVVSPDSVRFATRSGPPALPVSRVSRITYERDRFSTGAGATGGAAVGLIALVVTAGEDAFAFPLISGVVVVGGAVIGLVLGLAEEAGSQERIAYEGPVTRYMPRDGE
jgi:hypothetical protein